MAILYYIATIGTLEGNLHILFYQQKAQPLLPVNVIQGSENAIDHIRR